MDDNRKLVLRIPNDLHSFLKKQAYPKAPSQFVTELLLCMQKKVTNANEQILQKENKEQTRAAKTLENPFLSKRIK